MNTIIAPIRLSDDNLYCFNTGNPLFIGGAWRTPSLFTDTGSNVAELTSPGNDSADSWNLRPSAYAPGVGVVEFGVGMCVASVSFRFTFDKDNDNDRADVAIFVNGVQKLGIGHDTPDYSNPNVIEPPLRPPPPPIAPRLLAGSYTDYTLPLTQSPCGNIIKLVATMTYDYGGDAIYITGAVTGVNLLPPP